MKKHILFTFLILTVAAKAQQMNIFNDNAYGASFDKYVNNKDALFHTSMRPYLQSDLEKVVSIDSALGIRNYNWRICLN
jgi:hypothetical protein